MMNPSFDTVKNADWGTPPFFNHSPGHNPMRTKPQWPTNRRNHHQTKLPAECLRSPIPPAHWELPAGNSSPGGYQQPQGHPGPCAVELQGLPHALCRQNFLEAILDQAGLTESIFNCILGQEQNTGKALICFSNLNAAQMCVNHFTGCSWDKSGAPVSAQIVELQPGMGRDVTSTVEKAYIDKAPGGKTSKPRTKLRNEAFGSIRQPCILPFNAVPKNPWDGFGQSYFAAPSSGHRDESPNEGSQGSTMAGGSSGRASWDQAADGFDTDDGF